MIDDRHIAVLRAVATYYVLNRTQVQRRCFPDDRGGRVTRRHIAALLAQRLIARTQVQVVVPGSGSAAPVCYPTRKGLELLFEVDAESRWLNVSSRTPNPQHLFHWLAIAETHMALDDALARQDEVRCLGWLNEWDTADESADDPEAKFRLYTLVRDKPRIVCAPDAGFLLKVDGEAKVYYLEQDRNTSGVFQVAASKSPGFAALAEDKRLHLRHFPHATLDTFSVRMVTTSERRRDALVKAFAGRPAADLWRFACIQDLTPEKFLAAPVWHRCSGQPVPIVMPKGVAS